MGTPVASILEQWNGVTIRSLNRTRFPLRSFVRVKRKNVSFLLIGENSTCPLNEKEVQAGEGLWHPSPA